MEVNNLIVNGVSISSNEFNSYIDELINKLFKVLGIYENCEESNNFETFDSYVFRVITELNGFNEVIGTLSFISITSILTDLRDKVMEDVDKEKSARKVRHKNVKSIVFHCISLVKKGRIPQDAIL